MVRKKYEHSLGVPLDGVPGMNYGPVNELGVVALFALLSKRLGFRIERIQARFPDCVASRRTARGWRRQRIEFEYNARSFAAHRHKARDCDVVVCWENDWPNAPPGLEILDLRRQVEPRRVWFQSVDHRNWDLLDQRGRFWWSLPRLAKKDDLILFWHVRPRHDLRHVAILRDNATSKGARGWRWGGDLRVLYRLDHPVTLAHIRSNAVLRNSTFVRSSFRGRLDVTPWWFELYRLISVLNPNLRTPLGRYFAI